MRETPQHRDRSEPEGTRLPGGAVLPSGRNERGAVLVHVAVAMMGLLAFSALSIDLGTLWVARGEAQNAADAAALAGGVSLAYMDDTESGWPAAQAAATAIAQAHTVWGSPVTPAEVATEVGSCPADLPGVASICMGVVVSRNTASGSPLPVFFARMFGVTANEMHASARAKVMLGNETSCPRPLAIPDVWNDNIDTAGVRDSVWTADDVFDKYPDSGYPAPPPNADSYTPPSESGRGSGMTTAGMIGTRIRRDRNLVWLANEPLRAGDFLSLDLPRPDGASDFEQRYEDNIASCSGSPMALGRTYDVIVPHPGYTGRGLRRLLDLDPGAYWDGSAIRGSAFPISPRLITVAVFDPDHFASQVRPGPDVQILVRNIVGLFLEDPGGSADLQAVVVAAAGTLNQGAPTLGEQSAFLRTVALVR